MADLSSVEGRLDYLFGQGALDECAYARSRTVLSNNSDLFNAVDLQDFCSCYDHLISYVDSYSSDLGIDPQYTYSHFSSDDWAALSAQYGSVFGKFSFYQELAFFDVNGESRYGFGDIFSVPASWLEEIVEEPTVEPTQSDRAYELLQGIAINVQPHEFMNTNFAEYTVTEGLLLLAAVGAVVVVCIKMLKGGFKWLLS